LGVWAKIGYGVSFTGSVHLRERKGAKWSRLGLRGREEAVARVLACAGEPADGWVRRAVRRRRAAVRQAYSSARACRDEEKTTGRSSKLNGAVSKLAEGARVRGRDGNWTSSVTGSFWTNGTTTLRALSADLSLNGKNAKCSARPVGFQQ